jgi:hypothetical protein
MWYTIANNSSNSYLFDIDAKLYLEDFRVFSKANTLEEIQGVYYDYKTWIGSSGFAPNGSNAYFPYGYIGIGNNNPQSELHVTGNTLIEMGDIYKKTQSYVTSNVLPDVWYEFDTNPYVYVSDYGLSNISLSVLTSNFYTDNRSLIIWYMFDNSVTDMLIDNSGNGYNLTNSGAYFDSTNKIIGTGSVLLDSTNQMYTSSIYNFTGINDFSISFWLQRTALNSSGSDTILRGYNGATSYITIRRSGTNNYWELDIQGSGLINTNGALNDFIVDNAWNHYVITADQNSTNNTRITIHKNGTQVFTQTSILFWNYPTNVYFKLGDTTNGMIGYLDDLRIYKRKLSQTEISYLYNWTNANSANFVTGANKLVQTTGYTTDYPVDLQGAFLWQNFNGYGLDNIYLYNYNTDSINGLLDKFNNNGFTMHFLIKTPSIMTNTIAPIFYVGNAAYNLIYIKVGSDNKLYFISQNDNINTDFALIANTWYNINIIFEVYVDKASVTLNVNGISKNIIIDLNKRFDNVSKQELKCLIGHSPNEYGSLLSYTLQDFRIYSEALVTSEVTKLITGGTNLYKIQESSYEKYLTSNEIIRLFGNVGDLISGINLSGSGTDVRWTSNVTAQGYDSVNYQNVQIYPDDIRIDNTINSYIHYEFKNSAIDSSNISKTLSNHEGIYTLNENRNSLQLNAGKTATIPIENWSNFSNLTISGWFKTSSFTSGQRILDFYTCNLTSFYDITNLEAWYKFDIDATNMLLDSSGKDRNLTNTGNATFDTVAGNFKTENGSIAFGTSKYVELPASVDPYSISTNGISFAFWFKMNSTSGTNARIFDFGNNAIGTDPTNTIFVGRYGTNNNLAIQITEGVATYRFVPSTNYLDNAWHHMVWNISASGEWTLYIDNVLRTLRYSTYSFSAGAGGAKGTSSTYAGGGGAGGVSISRTNGFSGSINPTTVAATGTNAGTSGVNKGGSGGTGFGAGGGGGAFSGAAGGAGANGFAYILGTNNPQEYFTQTSVTYTVQQTGNYLVILMGGGGNGGTGNTATVAGGAGGGAGYLTSSIVALTSGTQITITIGSSAQNTTFAISGGNTLTANTGTRPTNATGGSGSSQGGAGNAANATTGATNGGSNGRSNTGSTTTNGLVNMGQTEFNNVMNANNISTITKTIPNTTWIKHYLGRSSYAADGWYIGNIDDFRIYNRILIVSEISTLYNVSQYVRGTDILTIRNNNNLSFEINGVSLCQTTYNLNTAWTHIIWNISTNKSTQGYIRINNGYKQFYATTNLKNFANINILGNFNNLGSTANTGILYVSDFRIFTNALSSKIEDNLYIPASRTYYSLIDDSYWSKPTSNVLFTSNIYNIGIGTTLPVSKLHIAETTGTLAGANTGSIIVDHANNGGASSITFRSAVNRGSDYAYIQYQDSTTVGAGGESSKLIIGTQNDGDDNLILLPSGNVGIATESPTYKLHVNGSTFVDTLYVGPVGGSGTIYLGGGHPFDGAYNHSFITTRYWGGSESTEMLLFKGNDTASNTGGPDRIRLRGAAIALDTYNYANTDGAAENIRLYIDENGNVGIGITSMSYKLQVNGTFYASDSTLGSLTTTGGITVNGSISAAGDITATGDIISSYSDIRLKKVISPIENPLEKIMSITTFKYEGNEKAKEFNVDPNRAQLGVSAQDVKNVFPEVVSLAPFDTSIVDGNVASKSGEEYLTVSYERLVPVLIECIKDLKKEVNYLRSIIDNK